MKTIKKIIKIGNIEASVTADEIYSNHLANEFEPDTVKLLSSLAKNSGKSAMDVGANIGMTSIILSKLCENIYSFEPTKIAYDLLNTNLRENNIKNVISYNFGLGENESRSTITYAPGNSSGAFVSDKTSVVKGHVTEDILIKRGDDLNIAVNFIKIDVEGYELQTFRGLKNTINQNKPIVMFEVNHWCLNGLQRLSLPEFLDEVSSIFEKLYAVEKDTYLDVKDADERYAIMYNNIINNKYLNFVGSFNNSDLSEFYKLFEHTEDKSDQNISNAIQTLTNEIEALNAKNEKLIRAIENLENKNHELNTISNNYQSIISSRFWKYTSFIRIILSKLNKKI